MIPDHELPAAAGGPHETGACLCSEFATHTGRRELHVVGQPGCADAPPTAPLADRD